MNCPNCGDKNAVALFTSVQCTNNQCQNYNQSYATESKIFNPHDPRNPGWDWKGTRTGRINCSKPHLSNLPRTKQTLNEILLSTQKENKRLEADNLKLAETIRRVGTGVRWYHDSFDGFAPGKSSKIKKKWDGLFKDIYRRRQEYLISKELS